MTDSPAPLLRVHEQPASIPAGAWDALLARDPQATPFLSHAYLSALHESGAATPQTGWHPRFLTLEQGPNLLAGVPLYGKTHSFGEYVFDWAWAQALERSGQAYYPKWLVAVPFAPVAGTRIAAVDDAARASVMDALLDLARESDASSLHLLFGTDAEIDALQAQGLLTRATVQFHWRNQGYASFDAFLSALAQDKRKKIRAERRKVREAGVQVRRLVGREITAADWDFFTRCYTDTYLRHGNPPYLNGEFFQRIGQDLAAHTLLVLAERAGRPIAAALGIYDAQRKALYGRHWGAIETVDCLHFECCYYQMIEFAIEQGLARFEGGAQGAHKLARGLDPVLTRSAHWVRDPGLAAAARRFTERERAGAALALDELGEHRAFREPSGSLPAGLESNPEAGLE
jgi:predicted N-acyltransferase